MKKISILNFRNIGIDEATELYLPDEGGISLILGENNVGKSNVLEAIAKLGDGGDFTEGDIPEYFHYEDEKEESDKEISVKYEYGETPIIERDDRELEFDGKNYGIWLDDNTTVNCMKIENLDTQDKLKKKLNADVKGGPLYLIVEKGNDEDNKRDALAIISPSAHKKFLCVADDFAHGRGEGVFYCFAIKNYPSGKKPRESIELSKSNLIFFSDQRKDKVASGEALQKYLVEKAYSVKEVKSETAPKKENYIERSMTKQQIEDRADGKLIRTASGKPAISALVGINATILNMNGAIVDKEGTNAPKVYLYEERVISDEELECKASEIGKSEFFRGFFKAVNIDISLLEQYYSKKSRKQNRLKTVEDSINANQMVELNKLFGKFIEGREDSETYAFTIALEEEKISLIIKKESFGVDLSKQSSGFRALFNFYFGFLYSKDLKRGDIVLMDEPDRPFNACTQINLKTLIRSFGAENGVNFVVSTHSKYFIETRRLEEIKLVVNNDYGDGAIIVNDFSCLSEGEHDSLKRIINAVGGRSLLELIDGKDKIVFVEGITGYNYYTAAFQDYERRVAGGKLENGLLFIPIGGLGLADTYKCTRGANEKPKATSEQEQIKRDLIALSRSIRDQRTILLVDGDYAGECMKTIEDQTKENFIVIMVSEMFEEKDEVLEVEDLFDKDGNYRRYLMQAKYSNMARNFKADAEKKTVFSKTEQERFAKLFGYLLQEV